MYKVNKSKNKILITKFVGDFTLTRYKTF